MDPVTRVKKSIRYAVRNYMLSPDVVRTVEALDDAQFNQLAELVHAYQQETGGNVLHGVYICLKEVS